MHDPSSGRTFRRAAQGGVGVALAALAFLSVVGRGEGLWHIVAFALAPDLPLLIGGSRERGRIGRWAVRPYNVTHRFVGPVVLATISLGLGAAWLAGALAWAAHIALDRSLGFGLRAPDGSIRPDPAPRPVVRALAGLAAVAVVGGAVYEAVAARNDADPYPAPGRLVNVGAERLHLHCLGSGSPTVVMEAGLGESSLTWSLVQPAIAATTRVCSYDRAGYGWSEPGPLPRSAGRGTAELRELLATAGESGPYVLVAHSLGANVARLFLGRFPEEVAGLVLVDPTDPETVIAAGTPYVPIAQYRLSSILGRLGVVRLFGESLVPLSIGTDPPDAVIEQAAIVYGPQSLSTAVEELRTSVDDARDVMAVTTAGAWSSLPVVVVIAGSGGDPAFGQELAALSDAGRQLVAQASGHYVQYDQPQIVVDAVLDVVASARQPR